MLNKLIYLISASLIFIAIPLASAIPASSSAQMTLFSVSNSPITVSRMQAIDAYGTYTVLLKNNTYETIEKVVLSGLIFQADGLDLLRAGGFSKGITINLAAGNQKEIEINLQKALENNFIISDIVVYPSRIYFSKSVNYFWEVDSRLLKDLKPDNINSFRNMMGKEIKIDVNLTDQRPEAINCQYCQGECIFSCGKPMSCLNYCCYHYYLCDPIQELCAFSCRNPIWCCEN